MNSRRCLGLLLLLLSAFTVAQAESLREYRITPTRFQGWSQLQNDFSELSIAQVWRQSLFNTPKGAEGYVMVSYQVATNDSPAAAEMAAKRLLDKAQFNDYTVKGYTVTIAPWATQGVQGTIFTISGINRKSDRAAAQRAELYTLAFSHDVYTIWLQVRQSCTAEELGATERILKKAPGHALAEELAGGIKELWEMLSTAAPAKEEQPEDKPAVTPPAATPTSKPSNISPVEPVAQIPSAPVITQEPPATVMKELPLTPPAPITTPEPVVVPPVAAVIPAAEPEVPAAKALPTTPTPVQELPATLPQPLEEPAAPPAGESAPEPGAEIATPVVALPVEPIPAVTMPVDATPVIAAPAEPEQSVITEPTTPPITAPLPEEEQQPVELPTPAQITEPIAATPIAPPIVVALPPAIPEEQRWFTADKYLSLVLPQGWKASPGLPNTFTGMPDVTMRLYPYDFYHTEQDRQEAMQDFVTTRKNIAIKGFTHEEMQLDAASGVLVHYTNYAHHTSYSYYLGKSGRLWLLEVEIPGENAALPVVVEAMIKSIRLQ